MMPPVKPDTALRAHGFARRLLAARIARELSQTALGERAGISHTQVSNLEAERHRAPGIDTAEVLARALDVPVAWLAYGIGRTPAGVVELEVSDATNDRGDHA